MRETHFLGEYLVQHGVITSDQLLHCLELQRESQSLLSILSVMERSLEPAELEQLYRRHVETGESPREAAVALGFMTPNMIDREMQTREYHRMPLGSILVGEGYIDSQTLEAWVERFHKHGRLRERKELVPILRNVPLFRELSDEELFRISGLLHLRNYEAGTFVFRAADHSDALYLVETGSIRIYIEQTDETHELGMFSSGDVFGVSGIIDGRSRGRFATAVVPSMLWLLTRDDFRKLLKEIPALPLSALQHMNTVTTKIMRGLHGRSESAARNIAVLFTETSHADCMQAALATIAAARRQGDRVGIIHTMELPADAWSERTTPDEKRVQDAAGIPPRWEARFSGSRTERADAQRRLNEEAVELDFLFILADAAMDGAVDLLEACTRSVLFVSQSRPDLLARLKGTRDCLYLLADDDQVPETIKKLRAALPEDFRGFGPQLVRRAGLDALPRRAARRLLGHTLGFALGGGGARVFAHMGFLEVIESEGIEMDEVCGASGGSVVAAMHAIGMPASEVIDFFLRYTVYTRKNALVDLTIPIRSLAKAKRFGNLLRMVFGERMVYDTPIPIFPATTDMQTGRLFVPREAPIWASTKASAAIPGFHPLVELEGRILGDGGVLNNVPASLLRDFGTRGVISVNITADPAKGTLNPDKILSSIGQGIDIALWHSVEKHLAYTDVAIKPNVDGFATADFKAGPRLLELGREEAERMRPEIRALANRIRNSKKRS